MRISARPRDREFDWADAVFVSGMHIQRQAMLDIARRAHARGKVCAIGGPSVSASPEFYGEFDYLHIGEVGDATDALIATLDRDVGRPAAQQRFETAERLPLPDFPIPAYHLIDGGKYMLGSVQFSSGCPYRCEFCDIPALYGRQPRLKEPKQILAELDAMLARGPLGAIYFVDDNFIANRKAARELLPHLIAWQKERGYPVRFACEATLNIAKLPDLLEQMREAYFTTVFCGIETPELARPGRHAQGAQPRGPAAGRRRDAQPPWHGGRLRHHPRTRHRHAGDGGAHQRLRRCARRSRCSPSTCCRPCRARRCGTG